MTISARTFALVVALVLTAGTVGSAQAPAPTAAPSAVTLQVSLTRQGDGKVSVQPISMDVPTDGKVAQIRLGSEVPVTMNGQTTMQQVGTQLDATVSPDPSGRFKVSMTITVRSLSEAPPAPIQQLAQGGPLFRNFIVASTMLLKIGESTQAIATDIITNESWQADITLSAKK